MITFADYKTMSVEQLLEEALLTDGTARLAALEAAHAKAVEALIAAPASWLGFSEQVREELKQSH